MINKSLLQAVAAIHYTLQHIISSYYATRHSLIHNMTLPHWLRLVVPNVLCRIIFFLKSR